MSGNLLYDILLREHPDKSKNPLREHPDRSKNPLREHPDKSKNPLCKNPNSKKPAPLQDRPSYKNHFPYSSRTNFSSTGIERSTFSVSIQYAMRK